MKPSDMRADYVHHLETRLREAQGRVAFLRFLYGFFPMWTLLVIVVTLIAAGRIF